MELFTVYHFTVPRDAQINPHLSFKDDLTFLPKPDQVARVWENKDVSKPYFRKVADLVTGDLDDVFEKTNHIDHDWTENSEIVWHADRVRSTSVGDVIIGEKQKRYFVDSCGFKEF